MNNKSTFLILLISIFFFTDHLFGQELPHYNGIYRCNNGKYSSYLRFYIDSTVVAVSYSNKNLPEEVAKSLHKNSENVGHGYFIEKNGEISFTITSEKGDFDYNGKIQNEYLKLNSYSHINNSQNFKEFKFISIDFDQIESKDSIINIESNTKVISPLYKGTFDIKDIKFENGDKPFGNLSLDINYDFANFDNNKKYQLTIFLIVDSKLILLSKQKIFNKSDELSILKELSTNWKSPLLSANSIKIRVAIEILLDSAGDNVIEICRYISDELKHSK